MIPTKIKSGLSFKLRYLFALALFLNIAFYSKAQDNAGCLNEAQLLRMQKTSLSDIRKFLDMEGWTLEKTKSLSEFQSNVVEWHKSSYSNGGILKIYIQSGKPNIVSYKSPAICFQNLLNRQDSKSTKVRVVDNILLTSIIKEGITMEFRQFTSSYSEGLNSLLIYNSNASNKELLSAILQSENTGSDVEAKKEPGAESYSTGEVSEEYKAPEQIEKQIETEVPEERKEVYTIVEEMPQYPGGENERNKFLAENIVYPQQATENGIQGTVYVSFVIDTKGNVTDVKILRGIGGGCDEEALRVVKMMCKWHPGKQNGKTVRVLYNMPIYFKL